MEGGVHGLEGTSALRQVSAEQTARRPVWFVSLPRWMNVWDTESSQLRPPSEAAQPAEASREVAERASVSQEELTAPLDGDRSQGIAVDERGQRETSRIGRTPRRQGAASRNGVVSRMTQSPGRRARSRQRGDRQYSGGRRGRGAERQRHAGGERREPHLEGANQANNSDASEKQQISVVIHGPGDVLFVGTTDQRQEKAAPMNLSRREGADDEPRGPRTGAAAGSSCCDGSRDSHRSHRGRTPVDAESGHLSGSHTESSSCTADSSLVECLEGDCSSSSGSSSGCSTPRSTEREEAGGINQQTLAKFVFGEKRSRQAPGQESVA